MAEIPIHPLSNPLQPPDILRILQDFAVQTLLGNSLSFLALKQPPNFHEIE